MFQFSCFDCGFSWLSQSCDVYECPMSEGKDIVIIKSDVKEKNER